MTLIELGQLMEQCGLLQINKLEWSGKNFIQTDEFIEGDAAALMQLVNIVTEREREECALLVERMGIEGYGTLAIGAAIRAKGKE